MAKGKKRAGKVEKVVETVSVGPTPEQLLKAVYRPYGVVEAGQTIGNTVRRQDAISVMVERGVIEAGDERVLGQIERAQRLITQGIGYKSFDPMRISGADIDWSDGQAACVRRYLRWEVECRRSGVDHRVAVAVAVWNLSLSELERQGLCSSRRITRQSLLDGISVYRGICKKIEMAA